jgi:PAS domain S-box-containing protein
MRTTAQMPINILKSLQKSEPNDDSPAKVTAQLDVILNCIYDHAILFLDLEGNITSWNVGAEKVKGFTEAEIIGRNFSCFYSDEDIASGQPQKALAVARDSGRYEVQGWRLRKNGERFWADILIHPVHDRLGGITGFVKMTRDITLQHHLDILKEDYAQSQKQEMIGQLTGGVAHDFNNLLTVIEAGHQLVAKYSDDRRISRVLEVNKVALDKSRRLIAQLLAFSRKQVLKPAATNINDTISLFDMLIEKAVDGNRNVQWNLAPELPQAYIDAAQLQSALLNLIVNARDAMPGGGTLKIFTETKILNSSNFKTPSNVPAGRYVVVGVTDTGTGMSAELCDRAIEPFFTTKDVGQGSGLGLSQCYGFARQSGGTLVIDSAHGRGTTVRIFLPALDTREKPVASCNHRTILLVDDEFAIRSLVSEMLRGLGHTVLEAEDARDAMQQLQTNASIDYLFTDIIMPNGINGLELLAEARSIRPGLPALLASGYPRDVLRNIAQLQDDVMFMQKPYTIEKLQAHIQAAADRQGAV